MPGKAAKIQISEQQQLILEELRHSRTVARGVVQRATIILRGFQKRLNAEITGEVQLNRQQVELGRQHGGEKRGRRCVFGNAANPSGYGRRCSTYWRMLRGRVRRRPLPRTKSRGSSPWRVSRRSYRSDPSPTGRSRNCTPRCLGGTSWRRFRERKSVASCSKPRCSSWLNQIEILFGIIHRKLMRGGSSTESIGGAASAGYFERRALVTLGTSFLPEDDLKE